MDLKNNSIVNNYINYLPLVEERDNWGLNVLNAGYIRVDAASSYPLNDHPAPYFFNWKTGRVLSEYQLIYVTGGSGVFESDSFKQSKIMPGTIILLFPGERHRYKPAHETGWDEYWIGFEGKIMDDLVIRKIFTPENPCMNLGFSDYAFNLLNSIIDKTKKVRGIFHPQISGEILHLLGCIHAATSEKTKPDEEKENIVNKAKLLFRSNLTNSFTPEHAACELMIGYSYFRKLFKAYTGVSPGQFIIRLKIDKAKELLIDPTVPIKEIAHELKFESYFYFSKLFKDKTGLAPSEFRLNATGRAVNS